MSTILYKTLRALVRAFWRTQKFVTYTIDDNPSEMSARLFPYFIQFTACREVIRQFSIQGIEQKVIRDVDFSYRHSRSDRKSKARRRFADIQGNTDIGLRSLCNQIEAHTGVDRLVGFQSTLARASSGEEWEVKYIGPGRRSKFNREA